MKYSKAIVLALWVTAFPVFSQSGTIFAPFISWLQAEVKNNSVRLTWLDSPDARGPVYIYRSSAPFDDTNSYQMIRPIAVSYGTQTYTEQVEPIGTWYYFLVASSAGGQKYDVLIPQGNTVTITVGSTAIGNGQVSSLIQQMAQDGTSTGTPVVTADGGTGAAPEYQYQATGAATPYTPPVSTAQDVPSYNYTAPTQSYSSNAVTQPSQTTNTQNTASRLVSSGEAGISGVNASVNGGEVTITFNSGAASRSPVLYRSVQPLRQTLDLLSAEVIQPRAASPYKDHPTPGLTYYYAVVYEDEMLTGSVQIVPGINATGTGVLVQNGAIPSGNSAGSSMPAAAYTAVPTDSMFYTMQPLSQLSPDAQRAIQDIQSPTQRVQVTPKEPRLFSQDLQVYPNGEEYSLSSIVRGSFAARQWPAAKAELQNFLSWASSSGSAALRAHFYLGQCYYFSGEPRNALYEFIALQSYYPEESNSWVQACLSRLVN
jgi:hypothetical protein